jgi:hypothetical protein
MTIEDEIQAAIKEAHAICDQLGSDSQACAVAWDTVEELQAEVAHKAHTPQKTAFQTYCEDHPEADECRVYDN